MTVIREKIIFKIIGITKERNIDGYTTITAMPDMEFYEGGKIQIRLKNCKAEDRKAIREMLLEEYYKIARKLEKKPLLLREGDLI